MPYLQYQNRKLHVLDNETILECALRHGINYPNSCRSGICQACLMKTSGHSLEPAWQEGLPDTLKAQGYFLACQAKPSADITIQSPDSSECDQEAVITEMIKLNDNVIKMKLLTKNLENWIPGQYLNLINPHDIYRSYSIANLPKQEGYIELHIKLKEKGEMSRWLQESATVDTVVHIRGPFGKCYYINPDNNPFDMLLVGTGTGLAPLIAIVKSAIREQHKGAITLIHGGLSDEDIYYNEELETLMAFYQNFQYVPCVLKTKERYPEGNLFEIIMDYLTHPDNMQVYVCGPKETTNQLKTKVFLAGVPSAKIYSDVFL